MTCFLVVCAGVEEDGFGVSFESFRLQHQQVVCMLVFWRCEQGLHAVVLMQQYVLESNLVSRMKDEINLVDGMYLQSSLHIFTAIYVDASSLYPNFDLSRFLLSNFCSMAKLLHQI